MSKILVLENAVEDRSVYRSLEEKVRIMHDQDSLSFVVGDAKK